MDLNHYNYFSIGVFSTGFSIFFFRWIRSFKSKKCKCLLKQRKTIVITGATSGLGKACAYELSKRNCKLILGCRNVVLGQKIANDINKFQSIAHVFPLDLSDLDSIKEFCKSISNEKIDILINNAGVITGHFRMVQCTKTEEDMTVNYLGPFLLTNLLLPQLCSKNEIDLPNNGDNKTQDQNHIIDPSRIIFISSSLCKKGLLNVHNLDLSKDPYSPWQAYANSKLALCLFSRELHKQLHTINGNINVITMFTGGMVNTGLNRNVITGYNILFQPLIRFIMWLFLKDPSDACHSIVHCSISDELNSTSDELFSGFKLVPWPERIKESMFLSKDLWMKSCDIVGLKSTIFDKNNKTG